MGGRIGRIGQIGPLFGNGGVGQAGEIDPSAAHADGVLWSG
jgi:hypothetical protein